MRRRQFLTLVVVAAAVPIPPAAASDSPCVKRLGGVDELLVHFEDGEVVDVELRASGSDGTGWDHHEAHVPVPRYSLVRIAVDVRVDVAQVVDHHPEAGPGATWVAFPRGARVTITQVPKSHTLAVVVERDQPSSR